MCALVRVRARQLSYMNRESAHVRASVRTCVRVLCSHYLSDMNRERERDYVCARARASAFLRVC